MKKSIPVLEMDFGISKYCGPTKQGVKIIAGHYKEVLLCCILFFAQLTQITVAYRQKI